MNEEIKFLREHIKDICSYKGLQEELTYDVPIDILKRICIAFDYLQQENQQLKEELKKLKQPTIFIDTQDMEERYGEQLYQDYLEKENQKLKGRINKASDLLKLLHHQFPDYDNIHNRIEDIEKILKEDNKEKVDDN